MTECFSHYYSQNSAGDQDRTQEDIADRIRQNSIMIVNISNQ